MCNQFLQGHERRPLRPIVHRLLLRPARQIQAAMQVRNRGGRQARSALIAAVMDASLGPLRSGGSLAAAVAAISADAGQAGSWPGRLALALLAPALARTSSLGAHYRVDSRAKHNIRRGIETPAYGEIA